VHGFDGGLYGGGDGGGGLGGWQQAGGSGRQTGGGGSGDCLEGGPQTGDSGPQAGGSGPDQPAYPGFEARKRHNAHAAALTRANPRKKGKGSLTSEFGMPPFSTLDGRSKDWQERKAYWEEGYSIQSQLGRGENLIGYGGVASTLRDTSVFDPVLTELIYRWWVQPRGVVLDPFAGGSVRGCVAARLGLEYHGVELSKVQVQSNESTSNRIGRECEQAGVPWRKPAWTVADAREISNLKFLPSAVDLVFTCPPYFDLEQYSDDPKDLSNAPTYRLFLDGYEKSLGAALGKLRRGRFACIVVGEVRDRSTGFCLNFVNDTICIAERHGAHLYNSAVLLTPCNTAPMRARTTFKLGKLVNVHQSVLVFFKGADSSEVASAGLIANQEIPWD